MKTTEVRKFNLKKLSDSLVVDMDSIKNEFDGVSFVVLGKTYPDFNNPLIWNVLNNFVAEELKIHMPIQVGFENVEFIDKKYEEAGLPYGFQATYKYKSGYR